MWRAGEGCCCQSYAGGKTAPKGTPRPDLTIMNESQLSTGSNPQHRATGIVPAVHPLTPPPLFKPAPRGPCPECRKRRARLARSVADLIAQGIRTSAAGRRGKALGKLIDRAEAPCQVCAKREREQRALELASIHRRLCWAQLLTQSDASRILGLPNSTVWRYRSRLEKGETQ